MNYFKYLRFLTYYFGVLLVATGFAENKVASQLDKEYHEQTGTAITIIFDDSGSMEGKKLEQAKKAFRSWLSQVPDDYRLSLITFQNSGTIQVPLNRGVKNLIAERVQRLTADHGTPICSSLRVALNQIQERRSKVTPYERHVILLFTDGEETQDSRGAKGVQDDVLALRKTGIELVGIGFHGEGDYLKGHATRYYAAKDEGQLRKGLSQVDAELGDIKDVKITPQDLKELAKMNFTPPSQFQSQARPPVMPVQENNPVKKSGNYSIWVIMGIAAIILVSKIVKFIRR